MPADRIPRLRLDLEIELDGTPVKVRPMSLRLPGRITPERSHSSTAGMVPIITSAVSPPWRRLSTVAMVPNVQSMAAEPRSDPVTTYFTAPADSTFKLSRCTCHCVAFSVEAGSIGGGVQCDAAQHHHRRVLASQPHTKRQPDRQHPGVRPDPRRRSRHAEACCHAGAAVRPDVRLTCGSPRRRAARPIEDIVKVTFWMKKLSRPPINTNG